MLINQQITDELKSHIWQLDWQNNCDDKNKYISNSNYREQVKNDIFTKLESEIDDYKDKVINQFTTNGFYIEYNSDGYSHMSANICKLYYKLKYNKNEKTNPFEADIKIYVHLNASTGQIEYKWCIDNPARIYYKRYLNWGNRISCNQMLFTRRGFAKRNYNSFTWTGTIDEWATGDRAKDICSKLKKTIIEMESEHEKLQKGVQLKKKELHIQEDEVSCMLSELNATFKDNNVIFLFNGECNFDYVDSPIKFDIICSNNPEQDDENLYVKPNIKIDIEEGPWPDVESGDREEFIKFISDHKMKLFSQYMNHQSGYYRSYITISLIYRPTEIQHWHYQINYPIGNKMVENLLNTQTYYDGTSLDDVRDELTKIFKRDSSLYKAVEDWQNGLN